MTIDHEALRRLADATTHPEPWTARENPDGTWTIVDRDGMWIAEVGAAEADAKFIAAATPARVIALLDEVKGRRFDPNLVALLTDARAEVDRLTALINTPRTDDFFEAVRIEAAHQIERWGVEHDAGKRPEDWIALFIYLLGKATKAHYNGDRPKLEHHVITAAAVALNWHRNMTGVSTAMRPGVAERWAACEEPAASDDVPACGWTGEVSQLVRRENENGVTRCPKCGSCAIREDIDRGAELAMRTRVLDALRRSPRSLRELETFVRGTRAAVRSTVSRLILEGFASMGPRVSNGTRGIELTEAGRAAANAERAL